MLNPDWIKSMPGEMVEIWEDAETDILKDIARRINSYDYYVPASQHQQQILSAAGATKSSITKSLSALSGVSQREISSLMTDAGNAVIHGDSGLYKAASIYKASSINTAALNNVLNTGTQATLAQFNTIIRQTAYNGSRQVYNCIDRAQLLVSTGAMSQQQAVDAAIKQLADHGLTSVTYPSGHVDSLETAVRRAVQTGVNQTALQISEEFARQMGCDLVEVSAHEGARPSHALWHGRVYSLSGSSTKYEKLSTATGYGTITGLGGVNCRHSFSPYIEGMPRVWSEERLQALEEENISYNGKMMTRYTANQIQRKLEREIRKAKRESAMLEAIGEDTTGVDAKISNLQKRNADFLNQTGLRRDYGREQIYISSVDLSNAAPPSAVPVVPDAPAAPAAAAHETRAVDDVPAFIPAENLTEVKTRLSDALGIDESVISLGRMNIGIANEYLDGTEEFMRDFPQLKGLYTGFDTKVGKALGVNKLNGKGRVVNGTTMYDTTLVLSYKSPKDVAKLAEDYAYAVRTKQFYDGACSRTTAVHELTHGLAFAVNMREHGYFVDGVLQTTINSAEWFRYSSTPCRDIVEQAKEEIFGSKHGREVYDGMKYLGSYSLTTPDETVAECVAYEYCIGTNPFSARVLELLTERVKEAFK